MKRSISSTAEIPIPEWITQNPLTLLLLKSISSRTQKQQRQETYAAAYVTNYGNILSIGRNMQVQTKEGWPIIQGYANHAEMMAFCTAAMINPKLAPGVIYVIGFLADNKLFIRKQLTVLGKTQQTERFTCKLCAKKACEHQEITGIAIPSTTHWKILTPQEALFTAESFHSLTENNANGRHDEIIPVSRDSAQKFLKLLSQIQPSQLTRMLEKEYNLDPVVVELIKLTQNGYIDTPTYKQTVFKHKKQ